MQGRKEYLKKLDVPSFLERPEVREFIGDNFDHYKEIWLKDFEKKRDAFKMGTGWHWCWMAFIFWPAWFGYRKMWPMYLGIVGALILLTVFEAYYNNVACRELGNGAFAGLILVMAVSAKNFYFLHVADFFRKHGHERGPVLKDMIRQAGGTSVPMAVAASLAFVAVIFGAVYAGEMFFPNTGACADLGDPGIFTHLSTQ